jgi:hypothetical protein
VLEPGASAAFPMAPLIASPASVPLGGRLDR